jgi:hypothetical protein
MCAQDEFDDRSYDAVYKAFDSPPMQRVRLEAYGKDIGQHSWVTAEELEEDIPRLKLTRGWVARLSGVSFQSSRLGVPHPLRSKGWDRYISGRLKRRPYSRFKSFDFLACSYPRFS